ncbi:MAG: acetyl-CoA carboxylase, carboxyl transferase, beta subunit [Gammaproteobacteria bacterium]|jgi:acetyl-CoA carboxylase carboxyl transferase subunit beta|nr:acetyl-CoA carboxylase, carboxyl transferase, beta subunit [Gammaproteobacteria bacterium]
MSWLKKLFPSRIKTAPEARRKTVPEGIWAKCHACQVALYHTELTQNLGVCPKCHHHHRMGARGRLEQCFDNQQFQELATQVKARDPLKFRDSKKYKDRLQEAIENTNEDEALIVGRGTLAGKAVVIAAFEFNFMGGSMGSALGERFVQGVKAAIAAKAPYICFCASGGARMQEGLLSLMQMAKTAAALNELSDAKLPFISILTDPTMGGVSASLAMLGDIILAEPNSLIGFAGPRVIEQTVRQKLPEGFQRSEFLLAHGAIDAVIDRRDMKNYLARMLLKFS